MISFFHDEAGVASNCRSRCGGRQLIKCAVVAVVKVVVFLLLSVILVLLGEIVKVSLVRISLELGGSLSRTLW